MLSKSTTRPATIIISDRSCHRRWAAIAAAILALAWLAPSPLEALPEHGLVCRDASFLC